MESVCCSTGTCGTCLSCALPGHEGTCTDLPKGADDLVNHCENNAVCDVSATCTGAGSLGHFGAACAKASDCFNGVCQAGLCKLAPGDPCSVDVACGTGRCSGNTCASCAQSADCASGHCTAGICLLLGGDPCVAAADCAGGLCLSTTGYCAPTGSEPCTAASCATHACIASSCATCSSAADCPLHTACTGGTCLAPPGAYCKPSAAASCASGTCLPPTLLDFPRCQ